MVSSLQATGRSILAIPPVRHRFAILASGRGTNAARLMDTFAAGDLPAELALVLSDRADAPVLATARQRGYTTALVPADTSTRRSHEAAVMARLEAEKVDHLLLAGYMRILSPWFLDRFTGVILNIHPSLLPAFQGLGAQQRQWDAGVDVAGATVHLVVEEVDAGPILLQRAITVRGNEGPEGLAERILTEVEHEIYPRALRLLVHQLEQERQMRAAAGTVHRALLSVCDKSGLAELGRRLSTSHVALLASGGTAAVLADAGVEVTSVEAVTGAPEMLGGRVKTLHPAVHAGILADRRREGDLAELAQNGHHPIDLVVCNLYRFREALHAGAGRDELVETIDIGGVALIRAAAKNADGGVTVVVDPSDYERVLSWIDTGRPIPPALRRDLAAKAFALTAAYEAAIAAWSADGDTGSSPLYGFTASSRLRYGENPHQQAALFVDGSGTGVAAGVLLQGKELSYNNLLDLDGAYRSVYGRGPQRCAIVKHTNPCGIAEAPTQSKAFQRALSGDPMAAFGSVIGFNRPLQAATAEAILASKLFVECIAAPGFSDEARASLATRRNLRLVAVPPGDPAPADHLHRIGGGLLVQNVDPGPTGGDDWEVVTEKAPAPDMKDEMVFAMRTAASLKSNAVCVTSDRTLRGAGAGLMSRIDACRLALEKAGDFSNGAVLASDGFFPFDDCVRLAADRGVETVVQPGGSRGDGEVIAACDELGLAMVFTAQRHFRH